MIKAKIDEAFATLVIWSPTGANSKFVRSEARQASDLGRLIGVLARGCSARDLAHPFAEDHLVAYGELEALVKAIQAKRRA